MQKLSQAEQVKRIMSENGGMSTLGFLYKNVDVASWPTKTPFASIRRIVQVGKDFFRIKPGLWGLVTAKDEIIRDYGISQLKTPKQEEFNHSYYQGLLVEIGNLKGFSTYIPNQDKNKKYLTQHLKDVANIAIIYPFTYPEILKKAKTVDIIWFNARKMPFAFFEVEHSADIYNSLIKFAELQDFNSKFNIVAEQARKREFEAKLNSKVFREIKDNIKFINYEQVAELHSAVSKHSAIQEAIRL